MEIFHRSSRVSKESPRMVNRYRVPRSTAKWIFSVGRARHASFARITIDGRLWRREKSDKLGTLWVENIAQKRSALAFMVSPMIFRIRGSLCCREDTFKPVSVLMTERKAYIDG